MFRNRTALLLLRDQQRSHEQQLARKDEQIQQLLDRIQHPERTPVWREPPPPLDDFDSGVEMRGHLPVWTLDPTEFDQQEG